MVNKKDKVSWRSDIFRHLDGIVMAPIAYALYKRGITDYILKKDVVSIGQLSSEFGANEGYLNVCLRALASQGWLDQVLEGPNIKYGTNKKTKVAFANFNIYQPTVDLMHYSSSFSRRKFEVAPFLKLKALYEDFTSGYTWQVNPDNDLELDVQSQMSKHIEGYILGPSIVALGMSGMFHKYFMELSFKAEEFHQDTTHFSELLDIFTYFGWFDKRADTFRFTDKGLFFARRASAYGVTVSYIPTLRRLDELLFGDPNVLWKRGIDATEIHVDRTMNVWGSGGAHLSYFKKIDKVIIDIFNKPIEEQPKGIIDIGCGNGAFLQHIFSVIDRQTLRGELLEDYPLFLVGADYNLEARKVTRTNLIQADIWAKVIFGDIGDPDGLAKELKTDYGMDLSDLLNVRTFLDHNRPWNPPREISCNDIGHSTGAYAYRGVLLDNKQVEHSLLDHFLKWRPYLHKYGLIILELHTLAPGVTARSLGFTACTAYDVTHGLSDQYIVELDVFLAIAKKAGLAAIEQYSHKFPGSDLATVSINLLKIV